MIRVIVFAVVGLVLGLGGGSGMAVMRAKKAVPAAHDSTSAKRDSTDSEGKHGDEQAPAGNGEGSEHSTSASAPAAADSVTIAPHGTPAKADTSAVPQTEASRATSLPTKPVASALPKAGAAVPRTSPDSGRAGLSAVPGRISKIFGAMSAKDAARVLEQMDDADVQTVLGGLNDRQAAAILAGFPPARAAAISRAAIRGRKGAS